MARSFAFSAVRLSPHGEESGVKQDQEEAVHLEWTALMIAHADWARW